VTALILAAAVMAATFIRPALRHDADLPISHTGKARK
jgi:hypothetical protein